MGDGSWDVYKRQLIGNRTANYIDNREYPGPQTFGFTQRRKGICRFSRLTDNNDCLLYTSHSSKERRHIPLDVEWINRFLDLSLSEKEMKDILAKLDCQFEDNDVLPPTFRPDLEHKADIAEEIARFYGYNKIPVTGLKGRDVYKRQVLC